MLKATPRVTFHSANDSDGVDRRPVIAAVSAWFPYLVVTGWIALDALIGSGAALLAPFQGHHLLSGLTVLTLLLIPVTPLRPAVRRMPALALLFAYLLLTLFSIGRSPLTAREFLTRWLVQLSFGVVAMLVIQHATSKRRLNFLIDATLAQTLFIAVYGVYAWFAVTDGVYDWLIPSLYRTGSVFQEPLPLAFFLTTIFPIALYRTAAAKPGLARAGGVSCLLVVLVATALTFSRGPAISFTLGALVAAWVAPSIGRRLAFLAGPALLWTIQLATGWTLGLPLLQRFTSSDAMTMNSRTILWRALLRHVEPRRLLGEGTGSSEVLLKSLRVRDTSGRVIGRSAHNLYVATLYEHGVIGLTLLILMFAASLWALIRIQSADDPDRRFLSAAVLASLVSVIVTSFTHTEFWTQSIGLYVWVILALPFARCWDDRARPDRA